MRGTFSDSTNDSTTQRHRYQQFLARAKAAELDGVNCELLTFHDFLEVLCTFKPGKRGGKYGVVIEMLVELPYEVLVVL